MAGHSKWANIKHRKGAQDAKRGKLFTRLLKEIQIGAKEGGPDPDANPRLRLAIQTAKKNNIPKDRIEAAISKGSGSDADDLQEVTYEGYASNGVAVFIEALTDNINRTVSNVRMIFSKYGGSLGVNGSVAYMFARKGVITLRAEGHDPDELLLELIEVGAEAIELEGENLIITCTFEEFGNFNAKLEEMGIEPENSELHRIPDVTVELPLGKSKSVLNLIEKMEDDDDVQNVFHNLEMTAELEAALSQE